MKPITIALGAMAALTACHSHSTPSTPAAGQQAPAADTAQTTANTADAVPDAVQPSDEQANLSPQEKQLQNAVNTSFDAERNTPGADPDRIIKQDEIDERGQLLGRCFGLRGLPPGPYTLAQVQLAVPAGYWTYSSAMNAFAFHYMTADSLTNETIKDDLQFAVDVKPTPACPNGVAYLLQVALNNMRGTVDDRLQIWKALTSAAAAQRP